MKEYIALDCHKHYTLAERQDVQTGRSRQCRIEHRPCAIRNFLGRCSPGSPVAVEATGNWYWIVDEIEQSGFQPRLVHPRKAKLMMGLINKTDQLDVHGLNQLQRNATLPTVWIPPRELRDLRELTRVRMVLSAQRVRLKNRIGAMLNKYGLWVEGVSDPYGKKGRQQLRQLLDQLLPQSRWVTQMLFDQLVFVEEQIAQQEQRLKELLTVSPEMELLMTLPGVGLILSAVITLEIGRIDRFAIAPRLASYAGTTPRVHSSGDRVRYGRLRSDVNHYLKWAFAEAANSVAANHKRCAERHVSRLYARLRQKKGHAKAIGAVARHLAEVTFYVLSRRQAYRDPAAGRKEGVSAKVS